ncbi:P-II family nitrogen regulator [Aliifodinibius sp. S!AR15-10]|uniref:P-II family nitrogen regulator n=1 Tax=Aliifodinibius sp. S!AR15-10 TaxID=2950437 RepID=UPI002858CB7C|nr:P-II family nitrogen regulator [Aliifodinibius sp. S!AR15-10]MDR8390474.1 P-II family nitrogen regulator [Aliifodinibius sp. S!AR15-10]
MKLIKAYIRLDMFEEVHRALNEEGFTSMTVMEAEGMGSYSDPENRHGSLKFPALHSKVVKLEMVSEDDHVDAVVKIIHENASTGHKGDGIMVVLPVERSIRVRDGEQRTYTV